MEKSHTEQFNVRLLLNAEPFGFGPSAAIASLFPYLRRYFSHIAYMGKGHTLDLQQKLPYSAIHDISNNSEEEIAQILKGYDLFMTAMDFGMAKLSKSQGIRTVIYDAISWYWKNLPKNVQKADFYIAQDFFGVKEITQPIFNVHVVPPIVSLSPVSNTRSNILVNLGGLQNPLWSLDDAIAYARVITESIRKIVPSDNLKISTSKSIASVIEGPVITSYSRNEMLEILAQTKCAFMTPGLGNIYDAAQYDIPTIWLPPANDSQGQQATLLEDNNMADSVVDWSDIFEGGIDYRDNQPIVLEKITKSVGILASDEALQKKLDSVLLDAFHNINKLHKSKTKAMLDKFGTGGAEKVADLIYQYASK